MSIDRDGKGRNSVVKRMWELASRRQYGNDDRVIIRHFSCKQIVPDKIYAWSLYERNTDLVPVETVELNVNLRESLVITDEVETEIEAVRRSESRKK